MANKQLTATFILNKTRKDRLEAVTELNAWGQDIEDLSILAETPHLHTLALACNNIKSLKQVSRCRKLRQLLLRKNQIADIRELYHLTRLPELVILSLSDNPVAAEANYRAKVLAYLPQLQKLDDVLVTPAEVEDAQALFPDAPHGISTDGSAADWTPQGPSPAQSPASTPSKLPQQQLTQQQPMPNSVARSLTPPANARTPPQGFGSAQQLQYGNEHMQERQQVAPSSAPPQAYSGASAYSQSPLPLYAGANGGQYYSPQQPGYGPNGRASPQPGGTSQVPQFQTTGWASGGTADADAAAPPASSGSDNVLYAIVALLPELSAQHLQWVRDEVDARLLELQQLSLQS